MPVIYYSTIFIKLPFLIGIQGRDNQLYVTFESGANKYRFTTTYVIDRMLKIDLAAWAGLPPHVEMLLEEDEAAPAEREGPLGNQIKIANDNQEEQGFSVEKGKADEVGIPISEQVNDDPCCILKFNHHMFIFCGDIFFK